MISLTFDIDASELERKLSSLGDNLESAMTGAVDAVIQRVVVLARTTDLFDDQTGALRASIRGIPAEGNLASGLSGGVVAGGGTVDYALYVHDGTRPHLIWPKNAKALRIPTGTGYIYRDEVRHPGTDARPFLTNAIEKVEPEVPQIAEAFVTRALRDSGLL